MAERIDETLGRVRMGRATLDIAPDAAQSVITALDVRPEEMRQPAQRQRVGSAKLAEANRVGEAMERELRTLCAGVVERLESIGLEVAQAAQFRGFREQSLALLGRVSPGAMDRAQRLRLLRLERVDTRQAVIEIQQFVQQTIQELGEIERDYGTNVTAYRAALTKALQKLNEATPRLMAATRHKGALETQAQVLKVELDSGMVAQGERPTKEAQYENLQRALDAARLEETNCLAVVNEAQRAIPELQKNAEAASRTIEAIHGMRRTLLEKTENFRAVLENAITAVRARAKLERFQAVDPAFNKAVELITAHNISVAGAAMDVAVERLKHAAIDPVRSNELAAELTRHIADFLEKFTEVEEEARTGVRKPRGNGAIPEEGAGT